MWTQDSDPRQNVSAPVLRQHCLNSMSFRLLMLCAGAGTCRVSPSGDQGHRLAPYTATQSRCVLIHWGPAFTTFHDARRGRREQDPHACTAATLYPQRHSRPARVRKAKCGELVLSLRRGSLQEEDVPSIATALGNLTIFAKLPEKSLTQVRAAPHTLAGRAPQPRVSTRAWTMLLQLPPHMPLERGLTHPSHTQRTNLASASTPLSGVTVFRSVAYKRPAANGLCEEPSRVSPGSY